MMNVIPAKAGIQFFHLSLDGRGQGEGELEKQIAYCSDYICDALGKFFEMVPENNKTLDGIKQGMQ